MKFEDCSFNGLKVTVGTKSVTHARTHPCTHAPKAICPINFFKVGGIIFYFFFFFGGGGGSGLGGVRVDVNEELKFWGNLKKKKIGGGGGGGGGGRVCGESGWM